MHRYQAPPSFYSAAGELADNHTSFHAGRRLGTRLSSEDPSMRYITPIYTSHKHLKQKFAAGIIIDEQDRIL